MDEWTKLERQDLFKPIEQTVRPYEESDNTWFCITFEMDLSRTEFDRSRYTFFDLLSDVGGLSGMLASIFAIMMSIWNRNALDNYLVTRLFKINSNIETKQNYVHSVINNNYHVKNIKNYNIH